MNRYCFFPLHRNWIQFNYIPIVASWAPTLLSMYEDQEILSKFPLYRQLKPILQTAMPRPIAANYTDMSTAIVSHVRQALTGQASVSEALSNLATTLTQLAKQHQVSH